MTNNARILLFVIRKFRIIMRKEKQQLPKWFNGVTI